MAVIMVVLLALLVAVSLANCFLYLLAGKLVKQELADILNRFEEREKKRRQSLLEKMPGTKESMADQYKQWLSSIEEAGQ